MSNTPSFLAEVDNQEFFKNQKDTRVSDKPIYSLNIDKITTSKKVLTS